MTIDTVRGKVMGGVGTGVLGVTFTKIDGGREKIDLTVILAPNAGLHLFLSVRAGSGRCVARKAGRQRGTASL